MLCVRGARGRGTDLPGEKHGSSSPTPLDGEIPVAAAARVGKRRTTACRVSGTMSLGSTLLAPSSSVSPVTPLGCEAASVMLNVALKLPRTPVYDPVEV